MTITFKYAVVHLDYSKPKPQQRLEQAVLHRHHLEFLHIGKPDLHYFSAGREITKDAIFLPVFLGSS